jgi:hypothetical protein
MQRFHDSLWLNGNVPITLQRLELRGPAGERERLNETRG